KIKKLKKIFEDSNDLDQAKEQIREEIQKYLIGEGTKLGLVHHIFNRSHLKRQELEEGNRNFEAALENSSGLNGILTTLQGIANDISSKVNDKFVGQFSAVY